jgi:soluble lytic murein transglycosylase-like protein
MNAGGSLLLVLGAAAIAAAVWSKEISLQALVDELVDALPGNLAQWARQLAGAAIAHAPNGLGAPRFARFVAAVMERESGGGIYLSPRGPSGTGDAGHGLGLMQLDDRAHPGLREQPELWQDPAWNVDKGAAELADLFGRTAPELELDERLQRAAAAYNRGPSALTAENPDRFTTGGDYGSDVLARLERFA